MNMNVRTYTPDPLHRPRDPAAWVMDGPIVADDRVTFGLLGPLLVTTSKGMPIYVSAPKQRVILAALLLKANTAVPPERLVYAVWGDSPPPTARAAIRTYMMRLRGALSLVGTRVVARPSGYAIEVRQPAELDLAELERLRVESHKAAEARQWSLAASLCTKALSLWRGVPLEDIPSAVLHQNVVEHLTELRVELAVARIDAELRLGRDSYLVAELRHLAEEHPLREHIQAQLMVVYYRCGRQVEALEVYRRVRTTLADELGIDPGPELQKIHQLILSSDPALTAGATASAIL